MNWGPGAAGGFQNALATGLQLGNIARQNALQDERLQQQDRRTAAIEQTAALNAERQERMNRRADLPMALRLLEGATDEASYQRNMGIAQQYGIDTSAFPQQFDPVWREKNLATMKLLATPQGQQIFSTLGKEVADMGFQSGTPEFTAKVAELWDIEQRKTIPFQQGGGIAEYDPVSGNTRLIAGPNNMVGGTSSGSSVQRPAGMSDGDLITRARQAIAAGKDPALVRQRLIEMGVRDPAGL